MTDRLDLEIRRCEKCGELTKAKGEELSNVEGEAWCNKCVKELKDG